MAGSGFGAGPDRPHIESLIRIHVKTSMKTQVIGYRYLLASGSSPVCLELGQRTLTHTHQGQPYVNKKLPKIWMEKVVSRTVLRIRDPGWEKSRSRIRDELSRVVDPYSFFPDPDPIRIRGFNDQKLKKKYSWNFFFFFFFDQKLQFTYP